MTEWIPVERADGTWTVAPADGQTVETPLPSLGRADANLLAARLNIRRVEPSELGEALEGVALTATSVLHAVERLH